MRSSGVPKSSGSFDRSLMRIPGCSRRTIAFIRSLSHRSEVFRGHATSYQSTSIVP
jgi:hypothetical protein